MQVTMAFQTSLSDLESPLCKDCREALSLWGSLKNISEAGDGRPSRGPPEAILLIVNSSLKERVATGCRLCTMIYDSFEGELGSFNSTTFERREIDELKDGKSLETWGYIRSWRKGGPPDDRYRDTDLSIRRFRPHVEMKFCVKLHRVDEKECTDCSEGTPHNVNIRNPPPWSLMETWLKDCIDSHGTSCISHSPNFLPTRLLYVGTLLQPALRLCLRDEINIRSKYFTLSHCWGPIVPKRLLLDNLNDFRASISSGGLSKTFQDAIYATRKLGIEYLWIDSLCIIQDSPGDWQTEAALMGQVYSSGLCNLAATSTTEGSQGSFLDKLPVPQILIDIENSKDLWHLNENFGFHWAEMLNFAPLNWRGWVFQERFLSTRVIHFGRARVYWECGAKNCCEWPSHASEKDLKSNSWTGQSKTYWQEILNSSDIIDKSEAVNMWIAIINHYSSHSQFTFQTDRLLAIAGLAERVHRSTQCRYFAGVWEHDFFKQLMWDLGSKGVDAKPEGKYVAPSWSWASVQVPLNRYMRSKVNYKPKPVVEMHDIDVQLVTDNKFGQVKGGSLTLVGRLGALQDPKSFEAEGVDPPHYKSFRWSIDYRNEYETGQHKERYLLLIEDQRSEDIYEGAGLVLRRLEELGDEKGVVFKRAGFFSFWFGKEVEDSMKAVQDEFDKSELADDLVVESRKDGKCQYLVKII